MKKVYVFALMVLIVISGCGSDDTPEVNFVDPALVGVWKTVSIIASNCENEENNSSEINMVCTTFECIQFTFDDESIFIGKTVFDSKASEVDGTYSASEGILTINSGTEILMGSYTVTNNQLVYTYEANNCDVELTMDKG
jgi:hypothetical protein